MTHKRAAALMVVASRFVHANGACFAKNGVATRTYFPAPSSLVVVRALFSLNLCSIIRVSETTHFDRYLNQLEQNFTQHRCLMRSAETPDPSFFLISFFFLK